MWKQTNIFGKTLEQPTEKTLNQVCCDSCYNAKEDRCVCKCGGAYHGLGNLNRQTNGGSRTKSKRRTQIDPEYEFILPEEEAKFFRQFYNSHHPRETICFCGRDLKDDPIVYYKPHGAGWPVKCESVLVWLYVKCPNCGYDMSIWKMGVPRNAKQP